MNENASSKNMKNDFSLLLGKQKRLFTFHWEGAHSTLPLLTEPELLRGHLWAAQKHLQACQRKKKKRLTRTHRQTTSDIGPQVWGGRSQSTREGTYPRDDCRKKPWRSCYSFGTKSFSGDRKTCCISSRCPWELIDPIFHRHLSEQGREGNPGFWTSSLWVRFTCSGQSRGQKKCGPCWLPLAGHAETVG